MTVKEIFKKIMSILKCNKVDIIDDNILIMEYNQYCNEHDIDYIEKEVKQTEKERQTEEMIFRFNTTISSLETHTPPLSPDKLTPRFNRPSFSPGTLFSFDEIKKNQDWVEEIPRAMSNQMIFTINSTPVTPNVLSL
jgi:hypothetical protein